jgi:hypothetical protein
MTLIPVHGELYTTKMDNLLSSSICHHNTTYYQLKTDVTSQIWSDGIYSFQERKGVIENDSLNIVIERQFRDAEFPD